MTIPNFLIVGDLKAGTTSLHYYLVQHPNIYMPPQKELRYFSYDEENPYHARAKAYRTRTFDEYLRYFQDSKGEKAIGEASPNYLRSTGAAQRIKNNLPNVRIIVSIRNPADRLYSLYLMHYRYGDTKNPLDQQLFGQDAAWIKGNFYWSELKRYYDHFEKDKIKVILFDDLKKSSIDVIKDLYRFLEVDDAFTPEVGVQNKGGIPKSRRLYGALNFFEKRARNYINPPPALKGLWGSIKRKSLVDAKLDPLIRKKILEEARDDIYRTQDLIGRNLSMWLE